MKTAFNETIIVVVGHSGSGKSTLAKALGEHYGCEVLGFSYAGPTLALLDCHSDEFNKLNNYIYCCISTSAKSDGLLIVDGVASDKLILRLKKDGFSLLTLFLDTPYEKRIQRMMKREECSESDAILLEHAKSLGKSKSGLPQAIKLADVRLDGSRELSVILENAVVAIEEFLSSEFNIK